MPRLARLDIPGLTHHVMARGIEKADIFREPRDYDRFVLRLAEIVMEAGASLFAWCLLPNHFHLLIRPTDRPLAWIMRRIMTGHAVWFNRRHNRQGHLFQNRYKSLVVEDESYFLALVRYIHLNPLRAGFSSKVSELRDYRYSGHRALLGETDLPWQDREEVLSRFSSDRGKAMRHYQYFIAAGAEQGQIPEFSFSGGAPTSSHVTSQERAESETPKDPRILGSPAFVEKVQRYAECTPSFDAEGRSTLSILEETATRWEVTPQEILGSSRQRRLARARRAFLLRAYEEAGDSLTTLARLCGRTHAAVHQAIEKAREEQKLS